MHLTAATVENADFDLPAVEFSFPEKLETINTPVIRTIRSIAETGGDLYLLCTPENPTNLDPKRHYVRPIGAIVGGFVRCASKTPDVNGQVFTDLFRVITTFAVWRVRAHARTYIILSPPPFEHMAAWERAFATVDIVVAWIEAGAYHPSVYSLTADIKVKGVLTVADRDEFIDIEGLLPGQKIALWRIPGKSRKELDNIRARLRRLCLRVEEKYQDRRFSTIIAPETHRWCYVYRFSEDEYDDWANYLPYDLAVLQFRGGKTITQELNQTLKS